MWHRGWGTAQAQQLITLMPTWVRLHARANDLIGDAFPCSTSTLLPEWEASLGLPDPCTGQLPTLQQRVAAVCAKFAARGGQSIQYFTDLAASLGYTITIQQFQPFRVNINRVGQPLYSEAWAYAFRVVAPPTTITYFRVGQSVIGEPLRSWGNELLECAIKALAPAHSVPIFAYIEESFWDHNQSIWDVGESHWDHMITPETEAESTVQLRAPTDILAAVMERARAEGVRLGELFKRMWQTFRDRDDIPD